MRENPKPFEVYQHFKGNRYQILTLATDSEDGRTHVVYQAMYGDYKVYVRELTMFMSETDREKYPDCSAQYRFEKVLPGQSDPAMTVKSEVPQTEMAAAPAKREEVQDANNVSQGDCEQTQLDPVVLEYLEAESVDERINILASLHHRITDEMINTMAVVTDVEINDGPVEQRYQELKNCLFMKQKFEKQRY